MRENMKMMGLQSSVFWVSWLIVYAVLFLLVVGMFIAISGPTLFPYTDSSILCLLFYSFAFNLLFLACLCSAFFSRAQSAGTLSPFVLLISFLPYFAVSDPYKSGPSKLFASLLSPVAFSLASKTLVEYQSAFQGITWQNINESHNNTSFAQLLTIMWLDTALYALLVLYLDRVMPSEFGTSESPFFCFSRVFWRRQCCQERESDFEPIPDVPADENTLFEAVPGSVRSVAHIRNLRKQFLDDKGQPFWAVKGVDLDLFEGQLFVLLGHNGAGKTTLFNMLTGMMPPSDGRAWLYGKEISDDMSQIRQSLGFCPQHDVLFPTLTVYEHLSFFLHLKRSSTADAHSEITRTATEVGLEFKLSAAASTLSGGQRRRLSLAIAFIGDSKLVFLDEPTSGVDPHSRRAIWDILNAKKRDRVVVLSTHFMDEADQLGDRIGIMHHGRLQCCGSPLFLKSKFGVGYTLTLTKLVEWSRSKPVDIELQRLITQHIPSANLLSSVGAELSFQLPIAASASFPSLLRSLEQQSTVSSYGLSVTTLEEVFMRVSRLATSVEESENGIDLPKSGPLAASVLHNSSLSMRDSCDSMQSIDLRDDQTSSLQTSALLKAQSLQIPLLPPMSMDTLQGSRFCTQFVALLIKRWHSAIRDRTNMFCQIVLPLILLTVGMALLRIPVNLQFTDLILSPSVYNSPLPVPFNNYTVLGNGTATLPNILDAFRTLPQQSWFASSDSDFVAQPEPFNQSALNDVQMTNALLDSRGEFASSRYGALIFNLSSNSAGITRWPHRKPATATSTASGIVLESVYANVSTLHGLATFTNLGHNLLLQSVGASIETHLFPFEWTQREKEFVQNINGAFSAICIAIAYSFIPAAIAVSVVKEREVKSKHLQLLSGVDALAYWASNFLFDFVCYLIPASIGVGIIFAYGNPTLTGENFATVALAFLLNGLSVIPFTYVCSFCFTSHSTAQNGTQSILFV
jgi:ATP-binding cassette subfamily A (ABC1) protein 3